MKGYIARRGKHLGRTRSRRLFVRGGRPLLDVDYDNRLVEIHLFSHRYGCFALCNALDETVLDFENVFVGRRPGQVFQIVFVFVNAVVARCEILRKVDNFVFVSGQNDEVRTVHRAVFGELEVTLRARELAKEDVGVECIVVDRERKRTRNQRVVADIFEVVGYFKSYCVVLSLFAVNGDRILRKEGITTARREDNRSYRLHVLIVVDNHIDIVSVLFESTVVLLFVRNALDNGSFVVCREVEAETVSDVLCGTAVTVVKLAFHLKGILGVVHETVCQRLELELLVIRQRTSAVGI